MKKKLLILPLLVILTACTTVINIYVTEFSDIQNSYKTEGVYASDSINFESKNNFNNKRVTQYFIFPINGLEPNTTYNVDIQFKMGNSYYISDEDISNTYFKFGISNLKPINNNELLINIGEDVQMNSQDVKAISNSIHYQDEIINITTTAQSNDKGDVWFIFLVDSRDEGFSITIEEVEATFKNI